MNDGMPKCRTAHSSMFSPSTEHALFDLPMVSCELTVVHQFAQSQSAVYYPARAQQPV